MARWGNWYATGNFRQKGLWGSSTVTRSDSESIFQQKFGEYHGDDAAIQYTLTAAQSLDSQDYYKKSQMMILALAGVLFCENEEAQTKWIVECSKENT